MEQIVESYKSKKRISDFIQFLKDSINWLCLVKECQESTGSIRCFLKDISKAYDEATSHDKINVFIDLIKKNEEDFKFIDSFFEKGQ